jgi:hypothetical protein
MRVLVFPVVWHADRRQLTANNFPLPSFTIFRSPKAKALHCLD